MWCEYLGVDPTDERETLIGTLIRCHQTAATNNDNLSSSIVKAIGGVKKGFPEAVAACLLSLGEIHGPVKQAREAIFHWTDNDIRMILEQGQLIPGFGNAFFKDSIDPAWKEMDNLIKTLRPQWYKRVTEIEELISKFKGKTIFPNAASYSAMLGEELGLEPGSEIVLVMVARLPVWRRQWLG